MKYSNLGIGLLLFAILLEMCSSGLGIILMLRSSGFGHTGCIVTKTKR